jgi:hypothetical protein
MFGDRVSVLDHEQHFFFDLSHPICGPVHISYVPWFIQCLSSQVIFRGEPWVDEAFRCATI